MNSIKSIQQEIKENILRDYLSGMETKEIMRKYQFKNRRTIYYHLSPLTQAEKVMHMKNRAKVMLAKKRGEVL